MKVEDDLLQRKQRKHLMTPKGKIITLSLIGGGASASIPILWLEKSQLMAFLLTAGLSSLLAYLSGRSVGRSAGAKKPSTTKLRRKQPRPPLRFLDLSVKALWSAKTYNHVFKPVIADHVYEWKDARRHHERFRAWWIQHVRGPYAVISVAVLQLPWSLIKKISAVVRIGKGN